jgi:NRPS condensation-like uncharacterized protein
VGNTLAAPQRTPFNAIDNVILTFDQAEPYCIHCELRVSGQLDEERLAAAVRAAVLKHPIARSRMAAFKRHGRRRYYWEIADGIENAPLEVLECPDEETLDNARSRFLSQRVDLHTAPPFALLLAHRPNGDSLILSLNHTATDGIGSHRLMRSIAHAYAGVADPVPEFDPLAVRDLSAHVRSSLMERMRRLRIVYELAAKQRADSAPVRIAGQGSEQRTDDGIHLLHFNRDETIEVLTHRIPSATVNDLLVASLALAVSRWNDAHKVESQPVEVFMPSNLRPTAWAKEIVSNIVSGASVLIPKNTGNDLASVQLCVAGRTRQIKEHNLTYLAIDFFSLIKVIPTGLRHLILRRLFENPSDLVPLTNLGELDESLDFGHDAGPATELWISGPTKFPVVTTTSALTMNGEMFLTVRYSRGTFDKAGATAFAETWRETLLGTTQQMEGKVGNTLATPQRTPLNAIDRVHLRYDQAEPFCIHCELRVRGQLDDERLAAAARAAVLHHPIARSRLAIFTLRGRRRYHWEIDDDVMHVPLEVVECPDGEALDNARSRFLSQRIELHAAPPFALMLAHRADGDSLILSLNHSAVDGISTHRLMRSIAHAYAGVADSVPELDPLAVRDLSMHTRSSLIERTGRLRITSKLMAKQRAESSPVCIAEQGSEQRTGDGFHLLRFNRAETTAVMAHRIPSATVNDLLVASLALTVSRWNEAHKVESQPVEIFMPVNLRPMAWRKEIISNIVSGASILIPRDTRDDLASAQLYVTERTHLIKEHNLTYLAIDFFSLIKDAPTWLHDLVITRLSQTFTGVVPLSNLGRLDESLDFGHDAGPATELWFSPPKQFPVTTTTGALTMNGEMFLTVRYSYDTFDRAGAAAFAETWRAALLDH